MAKTAGEDMAKAATQQALFKVYKDYNTGKIDASKMLYTVKNVSNPANLIY